MKTTWLAAAIAVPLTLSACSKSAEEGGDGDDGVELSIDLGDGSEDKSKRIKIGGEDGEAGKFSIKADGFSMDVDLPSISLDSDDFDLNNVTLYPGTKVTRLNVEDKDGNGGKVSLSFVAPAGVAELGEWYETKMTEEKFTVSKDGNALSGTTDEGDPFSLKLAEKSASETTGVLEFSEAE